MNYLLDTNICIYIIKKQPEHVLKKFKNLEIGDVSISSITLAELMYGVYKSQYKNQNMAAIEEFIAPLEIISFDEKAAACYGHIRAYLEKKGIPIGSLDMKIAAHAQSLNSILVTNNTREFSRIDDLKLEDWVTS